MAMAAPASAATFSGNATLTNDYVWRGSTQTQGDAAVQAGFKVAGDSGFYASIWARTSGSLRKPTPAANTTSPLAGAEPQHNGLDVNVLRYQYRRPRSTSTRPTPTVR
jgi:uncharacterized protein (TIGR02001 family)